jgi:hypothetical protein
VEDIGLDVKMTLKCALKKQNKRAWDRFFWLKIGTSSMLL